MRWQLHWLQHSELPHGVAGLRPHHPGNWSTPEHTDQRFLLGKGMPNMFACLTAFGYAATDASIGTATSCLIYIAL